MKTAIKICGITNFQDAQLALDSDATYLGLNFFGDSPRFLTAAEATQLAEKIKTVSPTTQLVGVFVDAAEAEVRQLAELCQLDILQFHGHENPDFCAQFELPVWRAFRVRDESSLADLEQFADCAGIVLDAYRRGQFGGTGQTFDWKLIHRVRDELPNFILSGGLNPSNVGKAIRQLRPNVVDVCSGVEAANDPRRKDPHRLAALFEAVRANS